MIIKDCELTLMQDWQAFQGVLALLIFPIIFLKVFILFSISKIVMADFITRLNKKSVCHMCVN